MRRCLFSFHLSEPVGCSKSYILEAYKDVEVSSPGFPANFPNDKEITCTYSFSTTASKISINFFGKTAKLDSQASLIVNCWMISNLNLHKIVIHVCFLFKVTKFFLLIYRSTTDPQLRRL